MHVIIKHIPKILIIDELETHLKSLLKPGLLRKQGELRALRMLNLIDKNNKSVEGHALVWVDSVASQQRLLKTINAGSFQNTFLSFDDELCNFNRISAAEFTIRDFNNDRRIIKTDDDNRLTTNRRGNERRRNLNAVTVVQKAYTITQRQQPSTSLNQVQTDRGVIKTWAWNFEPQKFSS